MWVDVCALIIRVIIFSPIYNLNISLIMADDDEENTNDAGEEEEEEEEQNDEEEEEGEEKEGTFSKVGGMLGGDDEGEDEDDEGKGKGKGKGDLPVLVLDLRNLACTMGASIRRACHPSKAPNSF